MTTGPSTAERAQETASTAADEGRHVAGVAMEEAANVTSEAIDQARDLVGDAVGQLTEQLGEQSRTQRDRLVGTLQSLGDDLEQMATQSGASGLAADLAREVADRTHALSSHLDGREPGQLLDDVRGFARNRPGTFLLGALAVGVVAGRLVRGAKDGAGTTADAPSTTPAPEGFPTTSATPATGAFPTTSTTPITPAPGGITNTPPHPGANPAQPAMAPATTSFADPAPATTSFAHPVSTSALDADGPMGTPAAGYGERGATGEERP